MTRAGSAGRVDMRARVRGSATLSPVGVGAARGLGWWLRRWQAGDEQAPQRTTVRGVQVEGQVLDAGRPRGRRWIAERGSCPRSGDRDTQGSDWAEQLDRLVAGQVGELLGRARCWDPSGGVAGPPHRPLCPGLAAAAEGEGEQRHTIDITLRAY